MSENNIAEHSFVTQRLALIDIWLEAQMAYQQLPGIALSIVHDQKVIYAKGYGVGGVASGRAVAADSIFRIASHSKLFAAISIMRLRDAGMLRLIEFEGRITVLFLALLT